MCHLNKILVLVLLTFFKFGGAEIEINDISINDRDDNVVVITVASDDTDGLKRYLRSASQYGIEPVVLGRGKPWLGGDIRNYPGGGYKINLLREHVKQYKNDKNRLILFTDAYDVILVSKIDEIIKKFTQFDARIVFSSEASCWPDKSLADRYPKVPGNRFLNSGIFMGYAYDIYKLLTLDQIDDTDDDQLYYTKAYLSERNKLDIKLDHLSELFQNLYGADDQVTINMDSNGTYMVNTYFDTKPLILHGNGRSKTVLNSLSNYLANSWSLKDGCLECLENEIDLTKVEDLPIVLVAIYIEHATPFLEEFFEKVAKLDYPKKRLHLFIHNNVPYHENVTKEFIDKYREDYLSVKQILIKDDVKESDARNLGLQHCVNKDCAYYFNIDSEAHLDNENTLRLLITQNRTLVAPMLTRVGKAWSNFWGALSPDGYYARSFDYMQIAQDERRGLWNVPFISQCYLINASIWDEYKIEELDYSHKYLDPDMAICEKFREQNIFMYVSNRVYFGHLVNSDTFLTDFASPEMYQLFDNRHDWEQRYIHEDFHKALEEGYKAEQPCPDVYWFPVTKLRFCKDLINMVETFGKWSDGSNYDPRLNTGYEAVPTRDIHMNQVDYEKHWLQFLRDYVRPLQESVFTGYYHDPPHSLMNFVVRYRPDEQPSLRPHHDTSTYTINLALNQHGVDYEGGGCRFIRYNCSVVDTKPGWLLMHPGRLTHFHEGLLVTKGTRYIMISFINP